MTNDEKKVIEQAIKVLTKQRWSSRPLAASGAMLNTLTALLEKQESVEPVCEHVPVTTFGGDYCIKCNTPMDSNNFPAPPTTQCPVPIEEVKEMVERLRVAARWGTMTSEFNPEDRIEYIAANLIERLAGIKES